MIPSIWFHVPCHNFELCFSLTAPKVFLWAILLHSWNRNNISLERVTGELKKNAQDSRDVQYTFILPMIMAVEWEEGREPGTMAQNVTFFEARSLTFPRNCMLFGARQNYQFLTRGDWHFPSYGHFNSKTKLTLVINVPNILPTMACHVPLGVTTWGQYAFGLLRFN